MERQEQKTELEPEDYSDVELDYSTTMMIDLMVEVVVLCAKPPATSAVEVERNGLAEVLNGLLGLPALSPSRDGARRFGFGF